MKKIKVRKKPKKMSKEAWRTLGLELLEMLEKSEREYEERQRREGRDLWKLMLEPITI